MASDLVMATMSVSTSTVLSESQQKENVNKNISVKNQIQNCITPTAVVVEVPRDSPLIDRGSVCRRLGFGFLLSIMDVVLGCIASVLFALFTFLLLGLNKDLMSEIGGGLCSHFGIASISLFFGLLDDRFIAWAHRKNIPVPLFNFIFLTICLCTYIPLYLLEYLAIVNVFQINSKTDQMAGVWAITFRQQLLFLSFNLPNAFLGGNIIPGLSGWRYMVFIHVVSFFVWFLFIDKILTQTLFWTPQNPKLTDYGGYKVLGGMIQTFLMSSLNFLSIYRFLVREILSKMSPGERLANILPPLVAYSVLQWAFLYGLNSAVFPASNFYMRANAVWKNISMSWIGFQVVGFRLSGPMWHGLCRMYDPFTNQLRHSKYGIAFYIFLAVILGHIYGFIFYLFFHYVSWPYIWSGLFNMKFGDSNMLERLDFTLPFSVGTIFLAVYNNDVYYKRGNWGCLQLKCEE